MKARAALRQRGAALLALLAVIALGASWFVVKQINTESGAIAAARKNRNAEVLNKAKQALIGYIAAQAAKDGENNPGAMPCPENPADFDDPTWRQGVVGTSCTTTTIGRFPWRTLGTDKLVDTSGEPLWYVVGPGWGIGVGTNTVINSNSVGQLTVNGVANAAVALIIAPGPAFSVAANAAAGCVAWSQVRSPVGNPDWRNYLECENASSPANTSFVTTGPSGSFNDQVIVITAADVLPAIEAAIAHRTEREIAPVLRTMYSGGSWSGSASTPWLPFAVTFADPSASTTWQNPATSLQGLLPLAYAETTPGSGTLCTLGSAPRCNPTFVAWAGTPTLSGPAMNLPSCTTTPTQINCTYSRACFLFCFAGTSTFTLGATASNAGLAMRQFNSAVGMTNVDTTGRTVTGALNGTGAAAVTLNARALTSAGAGLSGLLGNLLCGLALPFLNVCKQETFSVPITLLADHPLLDPTTVDSGALGWFIRNNWHEVAYYAIDNDFAPGGSRACVPGPACLTVAYHRDVTGTVDAGKQRAVLIFSGRSLTGAVRPNGTLADWLEGANADGSSPFEARSAMLTYNRSFNDRIAVLDSSP